jgi:hypothetical protein
MFSTATHTTSTNRRGTAVSNLNSNQIRILKLAKCRYSSGTYYNSHVRRMSSSSVMSSISLNLMKSSNFANRCVNNNNNAITTAPGVTTMSTTSGCNRKDYGGGGFKTSQQSATINSRSQSPSSVKSVESTIFANNSNNNNNKPKRDDRVYNKQNGGTGIAVGTKFRFRTIPTDPGNSSSKRSDFFKNYYDWTPTASTKTPISASNKMSETTNDDSTPFDADDDYFNQINSKILRNQLSNSKMT